MCIRDRNIDSPVRAPVNQYSVPAYQLRDDDGGDGSGSAYIFVRSGTSWSQQAKLEASDAAAGDNFGGAVSISGNNVMLEPHLTMILLQTLAQLIYTNVMVLLGE